MAKIVSPNERDIVPLAGVTSCTPSHDEHILVGYLTHVRRRPAAPSVYIAEPLVFHENCHNMVERSTSRWAESIAKILRLRIGNGE
jgi:hypothetical protein